MLLEVEKHGETCFKYLQIMEPVSGSQDVSKNDHAGILGNPSVHDGTRMITYVSMYYNICTSHDHGPFSKIPSAQHMQEEYHSYLCHTRQGNKMTKKTV